VAGALLVPSEREAKGGAGNAMPGELCGSLSRGQRCSTGDYPRRRSAITVAEPFFSPALPLPIHLYPTRFDTGSTLVPSVSQGNLAVSENARVSAAPASV